MPAVLFLPAARVTLNEGFPANRACVLVISLVNCLSMIFIVISQ